MKRAQKTIVLADSSKFRFKKGCYSSIGLENINTIITDEIFSEKKTKILEEDGVYIRSKESLHYYECFRKSNKINRSNSDNKCPDCNYELNLNSKFCRMCGKFPIN